MNELNRKRTDYNLDVWIGRSEATKVLEGVKPKVSKELEASGERELSIIIYPEEPLETGDNLWEAKISASHGVLKIEKRPLGGEFSQPTLVPPGRLDYLIGDLHPKVIIDFAKQVGKK